MEKTFTESQIAFVAHRYASAEDTPHHASYRAFARETIQQWNALLAAGFTFTRVDAVTPSAQTYLTSADMFADVARKQLIVDTAGQTFSANHPLADRVEYNGRLWRINEVFRATHDVLGHASTHCPFETFNGELEAYLNHKAMYSVDARPALRGETLGQLCYYFAGNGFVPVQYSKVLSVEDSFGF